MNNPGSVPHLPPDVLAHVTPRTTLRSLPGVNTQRGEAFDRLGLHTVEDLLRLAPRAYEDRRAPCPAHAFEPGTPVWWIGVIEQERIVRTRRGLYLHEMQLTHGAESVRATWFQHHFAPRSWGRGKRVGLYGVPTRDGDAWLFKSPERERIDDLERDAPGYGRWVPVHPASKGLTTRVLRNLLWRLLPVGDAMDDVLPDTLREALDLPVLRHTFRHLHFPESPGSAQRARRRLAYDELLVYALALGRMRQRVRATPGVVIPTPDALDARIRGRFPFALTAGQDQAVAAIRGDMASGQPMFRLVQGDVGSGKTAVAIYAILAAVAAGYQGLLLAPTEVLARQHVKTLKAWLRGSRTSVEACLGRQRRATRERVLAAAASGTAHVLVGTHALLSDNVRLHRPGLIVIDEEHKFGVHQRQALAARRVEGKQPHLLVMSATPIPRTLAFTVYGDLDVTLVRGTLPGRSPVATELVTPDDGARLMEAVQRTLAAGEQTFVVYPAVTESETQPLRAAEQAVLRWRRALPHARVGLLHGKLPAKERKEAMRAFREGESDLLVATTIVEVGVDVPRATLLIVEHAERFGLSQLHQLRGRVGRGHRRGQCFLVNRSEGGAGRLGVLARSSDGFEVAEEDLKVRGMGDLLGTRQHGKPLFTAAELPRDQALLAAAQRDARSLLEEDPDLTAPALAGLRRRAARALQALRVAPG